MTKAEALITNYNKKELADKVIELSEKLEEMKQVETQITASLEGLSTGSPAIGMNRLEDGKYQIVRIVYDLTKNAAAIVAIETLGTDHQIATGKAIKEAGEIALKASGHNFYK